MRKKRIQNFNNINISITSKPSKYTNFFHTSFILVGVILIALILSSCQNLQTIQKQETTIILERSGMLTDPNYAIQTVIISNQTLSYIIQHYNGSITKESIYRLNDEQYKNLQTISYNIVKKNPKNYYAPINSQSTMGEGILSLPEYNLNQIIINPYNTSALPKELEELLTTIRTYVLTFENSSE
jgi:hypothetical protein